MSQAPPTKGDKLWRSPACYSCWTWRMPHSVCLLFRVIIELYTLRSNVRLYYSDCTPLVLSTTKCTLLYIIDIIYLFVLSPTDLEVHFNSPAVERPVVSARSCRGWTVIQMEQQLDFLSVFPIACVTWKATILNEQHAVDIEMCHSVSEKTKENSIKKPLIWRGKLPASGALSDTPLNSSVLDTSLLFVTTKQKKKIKKITTELTKQNLPAILWESCAQRAI